MQGARYGIVFDSIVNDFVSGELEHAIVSCDREVRPDLMVIEGQSSLRNASGPCGAEMLLSAAARGVVLHHAPGREYIEGFQSLGTARSVARIGDRADPVLRFRNNRGDAELAGMHAGRAGPIPGRVPGEARRSGHRAPRRGCRGTDSGYPGLHRARPRSRRGIAPPHVLSGRPTRATPGATPAAPPIRPPLGGTAPAALNCRDAPLIRPAASSRRRRRPHRAAFRSDSPPVTGPHPRESSDGSARRRSRRRSGRPR